MNDETSGKRDEKDDDYRDDANEFGESSDYAQGRPVGNYNGGGPGQGPSTVREKGAQEWQDGAGAADASASGGQSSGRDEGAVVSRSQDPGQSSYGGFKNEGPVPDDVQQQQARALREARGPDGSGGDARDDAGRDASAPDSRTGDGGSTSGTDGSSASKR